MLTCAGFKARNAIESGGGNSRVVLTKNAIIHVGLICGKIYNLHEKVV